MSYTALSQLVQAAMNNTLYNLSDQLFIHGPAFADIPRNTVIVSSPCCGPWASTMKPEYTGDGGGRFPDLKWSTSLDDLMEYLLVVEDPDAPLPDPVVHGIYYSIPATETGIVNDDLAATGDDNRVEGGFRFGQNRGGDVYLPPMPMPGHGPHRYFYEVVGLSEPLDLDSLSSSPSREEMAAAVDGKVAGWGAWMGVSEKGLTCN